MIWPTPIQQFEFVDVGDIEIDVEPINKDGVRFYPIPNALPQRRLRITAGPEAATHP